jgi:hypothetical protein
MAGCGACWPDSWGGLDIHLAIRVSAISASQLRRRAHRVPNPVCSTDGTVRTALRVIGIVVDAPPLLRSLAGLLLVAFSCFPQLVRVVSGRRLLYARARLSGAKSPRFEN